MSQMGTAINQTPILERDLGQSSCSFPSRGPELGQGCGSGGQHRTEADRGAAGSHSGHGGPEDAVRGTEGLRMP